MKKFLGILFLLIIAAFGACAYFFPGLPYYYKTKHEFRETGSIWYELPDKLPELSSDSYDLYSALGLRITAWKGMEPVHTEEKDDCAHTKSAGQMKDRDIPGILRIRHKNITDIDE